MLNACFLPGNRKTIFSIPSLLRRKVFIKINKEDQLWDKVLLGPYEMGAAALFLSENIDFLRQTPILRRGLLIPNPEIAIRFWLPESAGVGVGLFRRLVVTHRFL